MEKKNYSRPMMAVETFVPNQFIATCWVLDLYCDGFPKAPNDQYQDHIFEGTMPNNYSYKPVGGINLVHT